MPPETIRESAVLGFVILYTAIRQFSRRQNESRKNISWSIFVPRGRRQDLAENVWCAQERAREKKLSNGVVNVRQCCVSKDASRHIIHSSTSKPPASIAEIQGAHIIR
jgi:hypothetical protein